MTVPPVSAVTAHEDNLPLTRVAQRDLWMHQFPRSCSDPSLRFLLTKWYPTRVAHTEGVERAGEWGMGSQLHLMTLAFSLAVASGRILVPVDYQRAQHPGCAEHGRNDTLECYFFPVTPQDCFLRAMELNKTQGLPPLRIQPEFIVQADKDLINSPAPVVFLERYQLQYESDAANRWIQDWGTLDAPFDIGGHTVHHYPLAKVNWWRSQAMRFMLRWPSSYLCHITNRVRHQAYGRQVALDLAIPLSQTQASSKPLDARVSEAAQSFPSLGPALEDTEGWRFPQEPYVPRPIVSVHVRQGDKAREMEVFGLHEYLILAQRIRVMHPGTRNIWLSTEMMSVIEEAKQHTDWVVYYSGGARQSGNTSMYDYERGRGLEEHVGLGFANLEIASQCDYFVGVLASNWNRLLNELRLTGGRMRATYMTLNHNEH